jgi:uncharacterized protein YodC (DUF2158 family)
MAYAWQLSVNVGDRRAIMDFEKGEVVILRSGSAPMTIRKVAKKAFGLQPIQCVWMFKGKKLDAAFDAEVLERFSKTTPAS